MLVQVHEHKYLDGIIVFVAAAASTAVTTASEAGAAFTAAAADYQHDDDDTKADQTRYEQFPPRHAVKHKHRIKLPLKLGQLTSQCNHEMSPKLLVSPTNVV